MPKFGPKSQACLETCHPRIQRVLNRAIAEVPADLDFSIICGVRPKEDQEQAVIDGTSWLHWPDGKHNVDPDNPRDPEHPDKAHAVDLVPFPVDWDDHARFVALSEAIKWIAADEGVDLHWGYDLWGKDDPHWQLGR